MTQAGPAPGAMMQHDPNSANVMERLAAQGNEGLELGYGSFAIVKLEQGQFQDNEGNYLGPQFDVILYPSKQKWIVKCNSDQNAPEFFYTHDQIKAVNGRLISEIKAEWAQKGWVSPVERKYLDVPAQIIDWNQDAQGQWIPSAGRMVLLSIPQTSIGRYSGYLASVNLTQTTAAGLPCSQSDVVTRCTVGAKVTSGQWPFNPWNFNFVAKRDDYGI